MTISPVSSALATDPAASATTAPASTTKTPTKTLGQDDFLKLLAIQFQQQDPLKPTDDTAFIAQMAQFTSLAQTSSINTQVTSLNTAQQNAAATNILGREVTIQNKDGTTTSGLVSSVDISGTTPQVTVNGMIYPFTSVAAVTTVPAVPAAPTVPAPAS